MTNDNDSALRHHAFHDAGQFKPSATTSATPKKAEARKRVGEQNVVEAFARNQVWEIPEH